MKKTTLAQLKNKLKGVRAVRKLLEDPKRWTTGREGRNAAGYGVSPVATNAVSWCLIGGLRNVGLERTALGAPGDVLNLNDTLGCYDPDRDARLKLGPSKGTSSSRDEIILHRRVMLFLDFNELALRDEYEERVTAANKKISAMLKEV